MKRKPSHSPYAGMMKWHHYAGLFFGLTTTTWIFSGLLSMTPWDWSPGNSPTRQQREAVTGGPLHIEQVTLDRIARGLAAFDADGLSPREVDVTQFQGEPHLMAYAPPDVRSTVPAWSNTDVAAFTTPVTYQRRFVSLVAPGRGVFTRFDAAALAAIAPSAMPHARPVESIWLDRYDSYYYDRTGTRPLPVLRVRFDDADATALYFDPQQGAVVQKEVRRTRLERWLYHGLHSLDFPFLYYRRPLWDIVLVFLSVGGIVSSATTLVPAWQRIRRGLRRLLRTS